MTTGLAHFKLSVDRYEQMIRAGILTENDRVELIRGELLDKMPIGETHIDVVNRLTRLFVVLFDRPVTVSIQNPLLLADSEPEPDLSVYTLKAPGKARASDVHLVVEVADSSLEFDRTVKLRLYAEAGIREFWIVNLIDQQIERYWQPQLDGSYAVQKVLRRGDFIEPLDFPQASLSIDEILG